MSKVPVVAAALVHDVSPAQLSWGHWAGLGPLPRPRPELSPVATVPSRSPSHKTETELRRSRDVRGAR